MRMNVFLKLGPVKTNDTLTDCDFYDKKSLEPKQKNVVNTGQRVVKLVWDNAKRVNHQKISNKLNYPQARRTFVPSGVLTKTGLVNPVRQNEKRAVQTVSTARPVSTARSVSTAWPISTARPFALKTAQTDSAIRPIYPRMDNVRPRASYSPIKRAVVNTGKGKMDIDLKKSRCVWRPKGNYRGIIVFQRKWIFHALKEGNPEILLQDHAVVDNHFPINALTTKVFSFMVKKGKKISGNVTPLFPSMLAQPTEDEGAVSERPSETQPTPSPTHPSEDQSEPQPDPFLRPSSSNPIPDSIPEGSGGNHGGQSSSDRSQSGTEDDLTLQSVYDLCVSLCKQVTAQAANIKDLKAQIKQLKKKA
ncbi:hypothetical protein Tco_0138811 [Tanacetum coccineum]